MIFKTARIASLAGIASILLAGPALSAGRSLTAEQVSRIGQRIWANECGGTVEGLTSWNKGEQFASLGVGHFIWYPPGKDGPFEESFPPLLRHLQSRGIRVPEWLARTPDCPWPGREAFSADSKGPRQQDLRKLLAATVREQTEFIILRLQNALPKMLAEAPRSSRALVQSNFGLLLQTPEGAFAMIDYVNFKGEGTSPKERYKGEGWGLLQVLMAMPQCKTADQYPGAFAHTAKRVLSRRVANSPKERGEQRWLAGWHNRCEGYRRRL